MPSKPQSSEPSTPFTRRKFFMAGGAVLAGGALASCRRTTGGPAAGDPTASDSAAGAAGTGPGETGAAAPRIRRYRTLGRTGFRVSDVSMGGLPDNGNVVRYAYDHGINYFDTAEGYGDGAAERAIGEAMPHIEREKVFITTKIYFEPDATRDYILERFGGCRERLNTDYVDALFIHAVDDVHKVAHPGFHAAAAKLKAEGRIRHVGISSHGPEGDQGDSMEQVLMAAVNDGRFDLMLLSYNFLNRDEAERVLRACKLHNVGTTAMKTMPGVLEVDPVDPDNLTEDYANYVERVAEHGVSREEAIERIRNWVARQQETIERVRPFAEKHGLETNGQLREASLQWVLQNDDMHTVCMGIRAFEDIDRFVALSGTSLSAHNAEFIGDYQQYFAQHYCRHGCTACARACPQSVPVSTIMRYSSYFAFQGREKLAMRKYAKLGRRNAGTCLACSAPCTGQCPHGLDVQAKMIAAHSMLSLV